MAQDTPSSHYLRSAAIGLRDAMRSVGLTPPPDPLLTPALLITLLTALIATAYLLTLLISPSSATRDAILIIGASPPSTVAAAPGKTTLFHVLRTGRAPPFDTLPTQVPNDGEFAVAGSLAEQAEAGAEAMPLPKARWVDYPGHSRLRPKMREYVGVARGVVFVVDSSAAVFAKTVREAADLLYFLLSDAEFERSKVPVLVFCNKADTPSSVAPSDVKTKLEAEMERARKAKAATLASARNATVEEAGGDEDGNGPAESVFLGYEDEVFSFEHVGNKVEFGKGSAKGLDVRDVAEFVASLG